MYNIIAAIPYCKLDKTEATTELTLKVEGYELNHALLELSKVKALVEIKLAKKNASDLPDSVIESQMGRFSKDWVRHLKGDDWT